MCIKISREKDQYLLLELNGSTVIQVHILYHIASLIGADLFHKLTKHTHNTTSK